MAPAMLSALLSKRQLGYDYCYDDTENCSSSSWNSWGRWVALAVIVVAFILIALVLSCLNNRRRRRRGAAPMYGTAWMPAPKYTPHDQNAGYYASGPYNGGQPAPPYSPQVENNQTGNTFNSNDGYYGAHHGGYGQQSGIELQTPGSAYQPQRGGDSVYEPPNGPPPGKGGYVVR